MSRYMSRYSYGNGNDERRNSMKYNNGAGKEYIITAEVYEEIKKTIGSRNPEQGGILGSSDGVHIDHYYFDSMAARTPGSYSMDVVSLNREIHRWNDNDIRLVGVIHSHPRGYTSPSEGDLETAQNIIEKLDVGGELFTPIVQVSPKLDGQIEIHPHTIRRTVEVVPQRMKIEEKTAEEKREEQMLKERAAKSPNRFKRINSSLPEEVMAEKKIICVGCGGSRSYLESAARCGIGMFVLIDGDKVEDTNIATQGAYISEIGKYKTEVIKERILDINPEAKVICINSYLSDEMTDGEFIKRTGLTEGKKENTLLCGCTDNFYAQDRCAQLSLKYGVPYLAAQIFPGGTGNEVIFTYPGLTESCPRCMLETRYRKELENRSEGTGSSEGGAVWITEYLNAVKLETTLKLLCYDEEKTVYYHKLDELKDRNYLMTRYREELKAPAFEPIEGLKDKEKDLSFPYVTVAIEQTKECGCPLCGGTGNLKNLYGKIADTRKISEKRGIA